MLEHIANGYSYEQILSRLPNLTYSDIFSAAREALDVISKARQSNVERLASIKEKHPRAYERWERRKTPRSSGPSNQARQSANLQSSYSANQAQSEAASRNLDCRTNSPC